MRARVLIADDHAMIVAGLGRLIEPEYELAGTAADGQALLELARTVRPDIVVVDMSMPVVNGLEAARRLRAEAIVSKIIFLTMYADVDYALQALEGGPCGFLLKQSAAEELLIAIREVLEGRSYITPLIAAAIEDRRPARLTPREREVLQLIAAGKSAKEAAAALGISTRTAEFHKYNVMEKLELHTVAELTQYAIRHGLLTS